MNYKYPRWSQLPYTGEKTPPENPEAHLAGTWPLIFLKRDEKGWFKGPLGDPIPKVRDPNSIDWDEQLEKVRKILANLTVEQQFLADYWAMGHVTKQITPIIDRLIDTYTLYRTKIPPVSMSTPQAARILALTQAAIQDAGVVTWAIKYHYDVARPTQQAQNLPTYVCTPRHPSYVSGHSVAMGVTEVVLSYFFPEERDRLRELAEECSSARVYGGEHFPIDTIEGLELGRAIGESLVKFFSTQVDAKGNPVDRQFSGQNPFIPPGCYPYKQAIPYDFVEECQSARFEASTWDKIKKFFIKIFRCGF